ncbi:MAG: hypothetical protein HY304_07420 [candidate division Zixibacteria bacterium]|nr:hypothetical protein [candidate division Zixibacteria bacterium]
MPSGWVHCTFDLIVFGQPYWHVHKRKDEAWKTLGVRHRSVDHDWYNAFGGAWTFEDPFPEWLRSSMQACAEKHGGSRAECIQASHSHDYLDRVWDDLSREERSYWEGFFAWVLLNPSVLREHYGVDVVFGFIERKIDNRTIWEPAPRLIVQYRGLRRYVQKVVESNAHLRDALLEDSFYERRE